MKKRFTIMAMAITVALASACSTTNSYYVSPDGDDNNSGSRNKPFQTIAKATSMMVAGDECVLMEGVYHETLRTTCDGTAELPITFKNYRDDKVVIDATEPVAGWTKYEGNIYKANKRLAKSESIYNTLFFEDDILDIARWPNNADGDKFTFDGYRIDGGSGDHIECKGMPDLDLTGGFFCYLGAHSGTSWSRRINEYGDGELNFNAVDTSRWPYTPHNPSILRNNNHGQLYLFGKMELLDHPGEWYYDSSAETLYAIFPDGAAPKEGSIKSGVRPTTVEIDHDFISLDGVTCFGGELHVDGDNCKITNSKLINCSQTYEGLIDISASSSTGTLIVTGSDFTLENNLIEGCKATAVAIKAEDGDKNYLIHNNVIRYFNSMGIHAKAINSNGDYTIITNNTIYTCGRDGITTNGQYCDISYNDLFDCMRINNDGGIYYTVGNDELKHTKIHHNYVHDSYGPAYADGRAAGIYLDNNSKGYDVYNNVVWNVTWSAIQFNWYNLDFNIYNNTIWDCGYNTGRWANGYEMDRIILKNNFANVYSREKIEAGEDLDWVGTEFDTNIIDTNPSLFISVDKHDFRPAEGSSLIDKGAAIDGLADNNPDVGAYAYGEDLWSVGASWADEVVEQIDFSAQHRSKNDSSRETEDEIFNK